MPLKPGSSPIREVDLAYAAGIFDGEGCVSFDKGKSGRFIRIIIVNTNRDMLEHIATIFGGKVSNDHYPKGNRKQSWRWSLSYSLAIEFLSLIEPWLIIKSDQAHLAFCWHHYRTGYKNGTQEKKKEVDDIEPYIKECFHYFNRRGTSGNLDDPIKRELNAIEWIGEENAAY